MFGSQSDRGHPEGTDAADALRVAAAQLRDVPAWAPFPVDHMPLPVRDYVLDVTRGLGVEPAAVAVPMLATLGGIAGAKVYLSVDPKASKPWHVRPIFWTVVIANSGSNKSAGWEACDDVAMVVEKELQARNKFEEESYEQRLQEWRDADPSDRGPKPQPAPVRQLLVDDTTVEALAGILQDNPSGVILSTDELRNWFDTFSRYRKAAGGSDATRWLPFHSGKRMIVNRKGGDGKTRQRLYIPHAAVSVMGTTQPKIFGRMIGDDERDSGFLARLLPCMPPGRPRLWKPSQGGGAGTTWGAMADLATRLYHLPEHQLLLDPKATARFVGWQNPWALESFKLSDAERVAMRSKLEEVALRVALLYHLCDSVWDAGLPGPIQVPHLDAGIEAAEWFFAESLRVYASFSKADSRVGAMYSEAMRWAVEKTAPGNPLEGGFLARDLYRARVAGMTEAAQAQQMIDLLVEENLLTEVPTVKQGRGRPAKKYLPAVRHNRHNSSEDVSDDQEET